ncbi:hypothetical protein B0T25DRAFT_110821 [Lasiosphaeria hispida]|uniref:Secreted protein n=1 Tax=Lasiosphaeria hispida TaxID=260671 RepID=A0AAJ0MI04_9PEZI|nr:hypothetical protein B0T25DRAFT_110821 [Lasiosphaeria hispida]
MFLCLFSFVCFWIIFPALVFGFGLTKPPIPSEGIMHWRWSMRHEMNWIWCREGSLYLLLFCFRDCADRSTLLVMSFMGVWICGRCSVKAWWVGLANDDCFSTTLGPVLAQKQTRLGEIYNHGCCCQHG